MPVSCNHQLLRRNRTAAEETPLQGGSCNSIFGHFTTPPCVGGSQIPKETYQWKRTHNRETWLGLV